MVNTIIINKTFREIRTALKENGVVSEIYIERESHPRIVGNIFKGKVTKIIPGMQAAFIDIGMDKSGFISAEDVTEESFLEFLLEEKEGKGNDEEPKVSSYNRGEQLIQDLLREGQELLVQAIKEPVGTKGPKLSSNVALPGKYLVLFGTADIVGVSRRIKDAAERTRLTGIIESLKPQGIGVIARTACENRIEKEIEEDLQGLRETWDKIKLKSDKLTAPALVYEEPDLTIRAVRDMVTQDTNKVIVDSSEVYEQLNSYVKEKLKGIDVTIEHYSESTPIFDKYDIEQELEKITDKKVWLKSGGYLIIDLAEALTVVDINTGKYLRGAAQEETIFKINIEAATETARQIRLRNLVGIIVIDFIDMKDPNNRKELYDTFTDALKTDKARSVVLELSPFGVIQMTRQRVRESLLAHVAESCDACGGTGYLQSKETTVYKLLRHIRSKTQAQEIDNITVKANGYILKELQRLEGLNLKDFASDIGVTIIFQPEESYDLFSYDLVTERR